MAKVIIFGTKDFASLAHFYLSHDSSHEVVAFSVHEKFKLGQDCFEGLPLVAFEKVQDRYPPEKFYFFAPMSHGRMNKARQEIFVQIAGKGYPFISYISSKATIFQKERIGRNCFILEDNTIQPFTTIGDNVVMWSGNHIGHHCLIGDHVFFTSHVVLSGHCVVEPYSFFGVNATIRDGLLIRQGSLIGMSACVTRDTEAWHVYKGLPAKQCGLSMDEDR
jgi:sugar O-acyltransferase (sialic acid O-acetyltransferase NeuD family)